MLGKHNKRKHKLWITQTAFDRMDERKRVKDKLDKTRTRTETGVQAKTLRK